MVFPLSREDREVDPRIVADAENNLALFKGGSQLGEDKSGAAFIRNRPGQTMAEVAAESAATAPGGAPIPPAPDVPPGTEGSKDSADAANALSEFDNDVYNWAPRNVAKGPGNTVMPEGLDFNVAGPDGKTDFQRAFVEGPKKVGEAIDAGAKAETDQHVALATHYATEQQRQAYAQAGLEAKRQANDAEMQRRQAELDQRTTQYSNDLADRNQFWRNPGNIVSAIAFSLMPIVSNDPAIGAKLINQAIDRDMADRKHLANMHLGELRSNLGEYRKLAGDQRIGDLLAEAEAKRIAAMEIDRIGQRFASPIAQAKKETLKQNFLMQSVQAKMQAYQLYHIYRAPQAVDPRIAAEYNNAGPGGFSSFRSQNPDAGAAAVKGVVAGTPTTAKGPAAGPVQTGPDAPTGQGATQPKPKTFVISDLLKSRGLSDPAQLLKQQQQDVYNEADAVAKKTGNPDHDAREFNEQVQKIKAADVQATQEIAKAMNASGQGGGTVTRLVGTRKMMSDMALIEGECRAAGVNPQEFLGELRTEIGGPLASRIRNYQDALTKADPSKAEEVKARDVRQASERFHQLLAGNVVDYFHSKAGAAQSPSEIAGLSQVIGTDASWSKIKNWVANESIGYQSAYTAALATGGNPRAATRYQLAMGVGTPGLAYPGASKSPGASK